MRRPSIVRSIIATGTAALLMALATAVAAAPAGGHGARTLARGIRTTPADPDFNGDGYADMAIGAIFEDVSGVSDAGGLEVLYGSASGLEANGVGGPVDQFWTESSPGIAATPPGPTDHFGFATSPGDFNADGYSDLAIAIELRSVGGKRDCGAVEVLYGGPLGLQADGLSGPDDQLWTQDSPGVLDTAETHDAFGRALASADFNGDGFADLAIGAKGESAGGVKSAGVLQIIYGSATGLQANGVGGPDDQLWLQGVNGVADQAEADDDLGRTVGAGDFNGDGYGDVAVGTYREDVTVGSITAADAGSVNVLYGSPTGIQANGEGGPDDQFWTQGANGVKDAAESDDHFGRAIAAGDFNQDGYDDMAVTARTEDLATFRDAGALNVIYGSATGLQANGVGGPDDQFWFQGVNGVQDTAERADQFGMTDAVGDFNADGYPDLAVSARYEDIGTIRDAGGANVIYGSATGLQANGVGGPDDQFWYQGANGAQDTAEAYDAFGQSLTAADFNGDGYADMGVGANGENLEPPAAAGAVSVLYGSAVGLQADGVLGPDDQFWSQDSPDVEDVAEFDDNFGWSLTGTTS